MNGNHGVEFSSILNIQIIKVCETIAATRAIGWVINIVISLIISKAVVSIKIIQKVVL